MYTSKTNTNYVKSKTKKQIFGILKLIGIGIFAGGINGFFGAGGGLLIVPLISFVEKVDSKTSHATTVATVMLMCVSSSVIYFVKKQIDFWIVLWCAIGSVCGSLIGIILLKKLKNKVIDLMFSLVLVTAGILMIVL